MTRRTFIGTAAMAAITRPRRVIIDTDPGTDDALAIFLALNSPELQIEALTPVAGNVPLELTLPNALRLLEIAGKSNIPVAAGAARPSRPPSDHRHLRARRKRFGRIPFPSRPPSRSPKPPPSSSAAWFTPHRSRSESSPSGR